MSQKPPLARGKSTSSIKSLTDERTRKKKQFTVRSHKNSSRNLTKPPKLTHEHASDHLRVLAPLTNIDHPAQRMQIIRSKSTDAVIMCRRRQSDVAASRAKSVGITKLVTKSPGNMDCIESETKKGTHISVENGHGEESDHEELIISDSNSDGTPMNISSDTDEENVDHDKITETTEISITDKGIRNIKNELKKLSLVPHVENIDKTTTAAPKFPNKQLIIENSPQSQHLGLYNVVLSQSTGIERKLSDESISKSANQPVLSKDLKHTSALSRSHSQFKISQTTKDSSTSSRNSNISFRATNTVDNQFQGADGLPVNRTQQRLWLQRENSIMDLSNQASRLSLYSYSTNIQDKMEFERLSREYLTVRRYWNPVVKSLKRNRKRQCNVDTIPLSNNVARKLRNSQMALSYKSMGRINSTNNKDSQPPSSSEMTIQPSFNSSKYSSKNSKLVKTGAQSETQFILTAMWLEGWKSNNPSVNINDKGDVPRTLQRQNFRFTTGSPDSVKIDLASIRLQAQQAQSRFVDMNLSSALSTGQIKPS